MKKPLRVISIDGVRGAGKSTQIRMLSQYFKSTGVKCSTLMAGDDIPNALVSLAYIESFLDKDPDAVVILDGSIARMMVLDLVTGMAERLVSEKYRELVNNYERLNHKYGILGILMILDDLEECNNRILKRGALSGKEEQGIENLSTEVDIVSGMRFFNNHVASKSIKFYPLGIDAKDSMMDVQKKILNHLSQDYEIKKPLSDDNGW